MADTYSGKRTSDLYFAAFLQTVGMHVLTTEREASGKTYWVFDASDVDYEERRVQWFNNTGLVPANAFSYAIKQLKAMVHQK
jgi:hypothetical protein